MDPETWKILLVDDEPDIRDVMALALEDAGCTVWPAGDGDEGLRLCVQQKFQVVITDVRMPGMDGLQLLEKVKESYPDIEVIVMTAFGEMDLAIGALRLGASDFINKPVDNEALFLALDRAKNRYISRKKLKDHACLLEREKARTTQELVKSLDYRKSLLESSMDGVLGCGADMSVAFVNQSLESMLARSRVEMLGRPALGFLFEPDEAQRFEEALASEKYGGEGRLFVYEANLANPSGKLLPVQLSATTLPAGGMVCFFRDLDEIRRLEQEFADQARILQQDKMISLGRLAASVVHEINNPLTGVLNYVRLMRRTLERGALSPADLADFQKYLELVDSETGRCTRIVSNLLDFSRRSKPDMEPVNLARVLEHSAVLSRHKLELSRIKMDLQLDEPLPLALGNFSQLQQCLINLIFNAMDAMPEGGTLHLACFYDAGSDTVRIRVQDTGTGINPEEMDRIFEPFYTTKQQGYGVGLGLSTVYGIMEHHKGSVLVESSPGQGATFTMVLPALTND